MQDHRSRAAGASTEEARSLITSASAAMASDPKRPIWMRGQLKKPRAPLQRGATNPLALRKGVSSHAIVGAQDAETHPALAGRLSSVPGVNVIAHTYSDDSPNLNTRPRGREAACKGRSTRCFRTFFSLR